MLSKAAPALEPLLSLDCLRKENTLLNHTIFYMPQVS